MCVCVCVCEAVRLWSVWNETRPNTRKSFGHAKLLSFASTDKRSKIPSHSLEFVPRNIEEKLSAWQRQHHRRRRPRYRWQWTRTHFEVKPKKDTTQWTWLSAGLRFALIMTFPLCTPQRMPSWSCVVSNSRMRTPSKSWTLIEVTKNKVQETLGQRGSLRVEMQQLIKFNLHWKWKNRIFRCTPCTWQGAQKLSKEMKALERNAFILHIHVIELNRNIRRKSESEPARYPQKEAEGRSED